MLNRLLFSILTLAQSLSFAQKDYAKAIMDTLCAERYHGRGYEFDGDQKAGNFLKEELRLNGIRAFPGKNYTQEFEFNVNTFPHPLEVVLGEDTLTPGADYLVSPISGPAQGEFDVVELNPSSFKEKFNGHINFSMLDPSQTIFAFNFTDSTVNKDMKRRMTSLSYEATKYFPVIYVTNEKQMYSIGRKQSNYPRISIDSAAYKTVSRVSLKINNKYRPKYRSNNVIGYVPGKKKKKYVVFCGHYDHLGRMGPETYFPGANDNASGCAMLLSLAKYYKAHKPKYSMLFCFFGGEEAGLLGSKHFVNNSFVPLKKVKMVVNIDIMGGASDGITVVNATKHKKLFNKMVDINEERQLIPKVKSRGASANSDHHFFSEAGVPAFFIYSMGKVKNYHDIYDTAENTPLTNFDEVQELIQRFVAKL